MSRLKPLDLCRNMVYGADGWTPVALAPMFIGSATGQA